MNLGAMQLGIASLDYFIILAPKHLFPADYHGMHHCANKDYS
jgi:hypothetical protein